MNTTALPVLPDIEEASPSASDDEACFADTRKVLARHGKIQRFGHSAVAELGVVRRSSGMEVRRWSFALAAAVGLVASSDGEDKESPTMPRAANNPLVLSKEYAERLDAALHAKRDVWGEEVLARPEGPTYDNVKGYLMPLMHGDPDLTDSGTYYIPFGQPHEKQEASIEAALHVADGSQFYSNSPANNPFSEQYGNTWNVYVGAEGDELYGSSLTRAKLPDLADGYPILQTDYVDAQGVRYRQESFAARSSEISDAGGFGNLVSWIRVTVESGGTAAKQALLNFVPSHHRPSDTPKGRLPRVLEVSGNRLISAKPQPDTTYLFFSPGAKYPAATKKLVSPALQYAVDLSGGRPTTVYLVRLNQVGLAGRIVADAES